LGKIKKKGGVDFYKMGGKMVKNDQKELGI